MTAILSQPQCVNPAGEAIGILQANINNMAADALGPCVTRPSAIILFTMQDLWVLVFYKDGLMDDRKIEVQCIEWGKSPRGQWVNSSELIKSL